ncbi:hypothetical protein EDM56_10570 [Brevibacillus fluminis]|uniref:Uncharacterized protein n=1 Tax=Brevibacillus fluminis TaxID=511487 RepID=A0A3M8DNF1_9BACL|nr:hypothetical protein [Brevibacillus fluminis]RNB89620.1 hypothetical protein EDM56_10570 [Brevibacillus fluminis]
MQAGRELDKRDAVADLEMCQRATSGDWRLQHTVVGLSVKIGDCWIGHANKNDAEFIAESRTALPYCIEHAETLNEKWVNYWNRLRKFAENNNFEDVERFMSDLEREMLA